MGKPRIRTEIASALREGFGDAYVRTERHRGEIHVYTVISDDPIVVKDNDLIAPDEYKPFFAGMRLDVQAILTNR